MNSQPNSFESSRRSRRQAELIVQRKQRLSSATKKRIVSPVAPAAEIRPAPTKLWESGMALGVNVVLISTAVVTLLHLVPYQMRQHAKLKEIRAEETSLSQNIKALEQNYEQNQSPEAAQRVAQQQGNLMPTNHMSLILTPSAKAQ